MGNRDSKPFDFNPLLGGGTGDGHNGKTALEQPAHTEAQFRKYASHSKNARKWLATETCHVCGKALKDGHFHSQADKRDRKYQVTIIGGGIIGSSLAYFLGLSGVHTCIIEREFVGAGASSMSAGTIWCPTASPIAPRKKKRKMGKLCERYLPTQVLCSMSADIIRKIHSKYDVDYEQPGSISVSTTASQTVALFYEYVLAKSFGFRCEFLAGHDLRKAEPQLSPAVWAGLHFPLSGYVDPAKLTHAFTEAAGDTGFVDVMEETNIVGIRSREGGGHVITTREGHTVSTDHVVMANGVWVNSIAKYFGLTFPVVPVKGQIWLSEELPEERVPKKIIFCLPSALYWASHHTTPAAYITHSDTGRVFTHHYYGRPTVYNQIMFGGLRMACPIKDYSIVENYAKESLASFQKLYPGCNINPENLYGSWSGLMPFTPTGKLFLGEVRENVWIANGFGPSGIMKGPAAMKIMSEEILERLQGKPVDPCRRFRPGEYIQ